MQNKYKTLYGRLKTEYKGLLIEDIKNAPDSVKLAKKSLRNNSFILDLTVRELDRLSMVLDLEITNNTVYKLFNDDNALRF